MAHAWPRQPGTHTQARHTVACTRPRPSIRDPDRSYTGVRAPRPSPHSTLGRTGRVATFAMPHAAQSHLATTRTPVAARAARRLTTKLSTPTHSTVSPYDMHARTAHATVGVRTVHQKRACRRPAAEVPRRPRYGRAQRRVGSLRCGTDLHRSARGLTVSSPG